MRGRSIANNETSTLPVKVYKVRLLISNIYKVHHPITNAFPIRTKPIGMNASPEYSGRSRFKCLMPNA